MFIYNDKSIRVNYTTGIGYYYLNIYQENLMVNNWTDGIALNSSNNLGFIYTKGDSIIYNIQNLSNTNISQINRKLYSTQNVNTIKTATSNQNINKSCVD